MRILFVAAACVASAMLAGCTGVQGYPETKVSEAPSLCAVQTPTVPADAANRYYAATGDTQEEFRRGERDRIMDSCANAIDASYNDFTKALTSEYGAGAHPRRPGEAGRPVPASRRPGGSS
jgi:outer membrane murein-binding lipoprotein Lpp